MSIEALVAKQLEKRFFTADDIAAAIRNALTEQAETHVIELHAYEATVANLEQRIRQIDERMQSYVTVGDGLVVYGTFDAVKRMQLYILLDSNHPVESTDSRKLLALELQKAEQRIRQLEAERVPDGFLSDAMTAAGLLAHGKTDRWLATRLREYSSCMLAAVQQQKEGA